MNEKTETSQEFSIDQVHRFLEQARTAGKDGGTDKVKMTKWETKYDKDKRTLQSLAMVDPLDEKHRISMLIVGIGSKDQKTVYASTLSMPEVKGIDLGAGGSGIGGIAMTQMFDPATHGSEVLALIGGMIKDKDGKMEQFFATKNVKL